MLKPSISPKTSVKVLYRHTDLGWWFSGSNWDATSRIWDSPGKQLHVWGGQMVGKMKWFGESRNSKPGQLGEPFSKKYKNPKEDQVREQVSHRKS